MITGVSFFMVLCCIVCIVVRAPFLQVFAPSARRRIHDTKLCRRDGPVLEKWNYRSAIGHRPSAIGHRPSSFPQASFRRPLA
jgi:hypothetical protein